jgi:hypothetical protein
MIARARRGEEAVRAVRAGGPGWAAFKKLTSNCRA